MRSDELKGSVVKRPPYLLYCLFLAILINGCASGRNLIVLLPDNEGHVGQVDVSNKAGVLTITKAWQAGHVKNDTTPPSSDAIAREKVDKVFAAALEALPDPPARFIVYFKPESAELNDKARAILADILQEIQARSSKDIGVSGYTDSMGTDDYNIKLSSRRAVRIKELLVSEGISPENIEIRYFGKSNPLISVGDNVPEPRNRRVEVYVR